MFKNMKISIKLLLAIIIMSMGSLLIVFIASFYVMNVMVDEFEQANIMLGVNSSNVTKDSLLSQTENYQFMLVEKQAQASNKQLYSINRIVTESAQYVTSLYNHPSNFEGRKLPKPYETKDGVACSKYILVKGIEETPQIQDELRLLSNCEYLFAPYLENNEMVDNIYIGTKSGISYRYSRSNAYNEDYDPRERDWYKEAMAQQDTLVWLPTYLDSYGNICITAAMSFRDASGKTVGVVASDVRLTSLVDDIMNLRIGETGSCFVLDSAFQFIAHPNMESEAFDAELKNHFGDDAFLKAIQSETNGIVETVYEGQESYVAFSRLEETGWLFCASIDTAEVTAPAENAKKDSDALTEEAQQKMQGRLSNVYKLFMVYFAIVGIVVIMISFAVSGTITNPIQRLTGAVGQIGQGNFDLKIPVESQDEVGQLALRFNEMQDNLNEYMNRIQKVTAEKERIGAELELATRIQAGMLPNIFPAFPERPDFDIYASMTPAKEVGGDFYDFFLIDDDHLAMVIADVSGKGVPAALFMMMSMILLNNTTHMDGPEASPGAVLTKVNNAICANNEQEMFVTVWLGILTISTGRVVASNAGHEYPMIRKADGSFELMKDKHGLVVGGMEGVRFRDYEFNLGNGDTLFVYTDGVAEATNAQNELFGTERTLEALNQDPNATPKDLLTNVKASVDRFVGDTPQFDDLTMLSVKRT